jgi:hypothetical protein
MLRLKHVFAPRIKTLTLPLPIEQVAKADAAAAGGSS